jgi:signal transduction histidine kinase
MDTTGTSGLTTFGLWPARVLPREGCHNRAVASPSDRRANVARFTAGAIGLTYALAALAVALGPGEFTTYAGRSVPAAALAVVAGLALFAGGLVMTYRRSTLRVGRLAMVAGLVWFAPFWVGWAGGPPLVRSLGMVFAVFLFPILLHLVVAYPNGQLQSRAARALVAAVYLEAILSAIGRALFRDPFVDPRCWDNCTDNVFLVRSIPGIARGIQDVDVLVVAVAAGALAILSVRRLLIATGPGQQADWPMSVAGIALATATGAHSIALSRATEDPVDGTFLSIFIVECGAVALVGGSLLWNALSARVQRRSVGRIVANLGEAPTPGSLESALAKAVGDPELRIAYWLSASGRYVDAHGSAVAEPTASAGRVSTKLVRNGQQVAVVNHTASVAELEPELGAAIRLAIDNERLQAEVLAQLGDLRASRTRIVETGDAERRRLEHDLHDGAQQRLLALSYDLRLAGAAARADGDPEAASLLAEATAEAQEALRDLRELAHGIYPAILTEAGLASAIATLADAAPLPVEILATPLEDRYAAPVETAIYLVAAEAIEDAGARDASHVTLSLVREDDWLVLDAADDGSARTSLLVHLADRVGALGGSLKVAPTWVRAEVPCV